jgi:hypothetical protein
VGCEVEGKSMKITEEEQKKIIHVAAVRGNNPSGFRDAVHEIAHVIYVGIEDAESWDRNDAIHLEFEELPPGDQFRLEVRARACERVACEMAGIDYDVEHWAALAGIEAMKGGVSTSLQNWIDIINVNYDSGAGAKLFEQVRELARRLS